MLKKIMLLSVVLFALAYPKPVVMDNPIPECPPYCSQAQ